MRLVWIAVTVLLASQCAAYAQQAPMPAGQLVRQVVYNELNDHQGHGYWRYWIERHTPRETRLEDQVETADGPVTRLALTNGHAPTAESRQAEQARLQHLLTSPAEQAHHRQEYADDEARIGRVLALLPDAFIYQYDGMENGCWRLQFHPDPNFPAHSIEARVFHAMSGTLWVDARMKRLARLDAHTIDNVDFGFGILGRLNKGGWFQLVRTQVSPTDWKTAKLEMHMFGRALLVKSFARETSEARGGFLPVPPAMNLADGMKLLDQSAAIAAPPRPQSRGNLAQAALVLRP